MLTHADVVVIGSGAFGASVGYHLTRLGREVVILDRFDRASQTSPRAAGQTQKIRYDQVTSQMAIRSVEKLIGFEEETGEPLTVHQVGALKFARTPEYAAQVREEVERGQAWGIDIELVDQARARELAPYADPGRALAIWWTGSDVYLEPGDLPRAYLKAAASMGAAIHSGVTVTDIVVRGSAVERVVTDQGEIDAPVVINAAGAWAPLVAAMAGMRLPTYPVRHQLFITEPIASVTADMPIVRVVDANIYVRPERGGLMVGGYEPDPIAVDPRVLAAGMADLALDITPLRRIVEDVGPEYPELVDAPVAELRGGLPTMTPDGHHLFGETSAVRGLWIMSGCVVAGLSISPAAGEIMADWIVNGRTEYDMSQFALDRFGDRYDDPTVLAKACLARYSHHYETPE